MRITASKSSRFVAYVFAFCVGVVAGFLLFDSRVILSNLWWGMIFVPPLILFWRFQHARFFILLIFFCGFGVLRSGVALPGDSPIRNIANARTRISATGYISAEPRWDDGAMEYVVRLDNPEGRIWVRSDPHPVLPYGTGVRLSCTLVLPEPTDNFAFDKFAAMRGIDALCVRAELEPSGEVAGSELYALLLSGKARFQSVIDKNLPEPHASFLGGLLYGLRATIPAELSEAFNRTGTTHIIAISGYNITLVSALFMTALLGLGFRRQRAFWIATSSIVLFVFLVGAQASVVRAAVMGIVLLISLQLGRGGKSAPLLALAALLMVAHNPYSLLYDVGFQLSFVAVIGLIYLSSDIERLFSRLPKSLATMLAQTISAIVLTTPLIMYTFGRVSVVAPLVNALILPAIPTIMFMGFFSSTFTIMLRPIGLILFWLTWVLLSYVIVIIGFIARWPLSSVSASLSLYGMLISYAILFYIMRFRYEQG